MNSLVKVLRQTKYTLVEQELFLNCCFLSLVPPSFLESNMVKKSDNLLTLDSIYLLCCSTVVNTFISQIILDFESGPLVDSSSLRLSLKKYLLKFRYSYCQSKSTYLSRYENSRTLTYSQLNKIAIDYLFLVVRSY